MRVKKFNENIEKAELSNLKDMPTRLSMTKSNTSMYNMSPKSKK